MESQNGTILEAALVVFVPEAEALIRPFRDKYEQTASEGLLAHITINYPFQALQPERKLLIKDLSALFAGFPPVRFKLTELSQFPDTLYLAVEPEQPFRDMIEAVATHYPESPPYGGAITEIVPHLTITGIPKDADPNDIRREFTAAARGKLPIGGKASQVWLIEYRNNYWSKTVAFDLGG